MIYNEGILDISALYWKKYHIIPSKDVYSNVDLSLLCKGFDNFKGKVSCNFIDKNPTEFVFLFKHKIIMYYGDNTVVLLHNDCKYIDKIKEIVESCIVNPEITPSNIGFVTYRDGNYTVGTIETLDHCEEEIDEKLNNFITSDEKIIFTSSYIEPVINNHKDITFVYFPNDLLSIFLTASILDLLMKMSGFILILENPKLSDLDKVYDFFNSIIYKDIHLKVIVKQQLNRKQIGFSI